MVRNHDDVLIVGGGPAGCAAACLLARRGHPVRLLADAAPPERSLAESIPPSCRKLFTVIGVADRIDAAPFVRSTGNTVWWGDGVPRVETFARGERGWQVTDAALSAILLAAAEDAGARLERGRATVDDLSSDRPALVLDCTGRSGLVARARNLRVHEQSHRTVALVGHWRRGNEWPIPDRTHTLIESYEGGWAWSVPLALNDVTLRHGRAVAVMVDPRTSNLTRAHTARDVYLGEIGKTRHFGVVLRDAVLENGPWGWDASMYRATRYVDGGVLLVGDAGSFIDPLSSAGIKKALASGWLAAVAAHTALSRPSMRETAMQFFEAREIEMYASFKRLTERHLSSAAAEHDHPFWIDRAADFAEADTSPEEADRSRGAFEQLKAATEIRLRLSPNLRIEPRPAVSGFEIVMEPRLITPDRSQGIRYLHDVDLIALSELAPRERHVPDLFERYARQAAPVALPSFLLALAAAIANGWLVWDDAPPDPS